MPAFATHFFYALDVYRKLDDETKEKIDKYRSFYDLGAQGPDIFFYYKPYKKNNISKYGQSIHNKQARKFFEVALKNSKEKDPDEVSLVYLLGFTTHFVLDSSFHPTINKVCKTFNEHMILEAEMDRNLIEKNVKRPPHKFRRYYLINRGKKYGPFLQLVYPNVSEKIIDETVYQTNFYMKRLYSPNNIKGKIISALSRKFADGTDFSNLIVKKEPNHQFDETINELLSNYEEMVDLGVKYVNNVLDYYNGKGKLDKYFNNNFE